MLRVFTRFVLRHPILMAVNEGIDIGFQGIRAYKMRAFLTILGVVMGIMTVTGMSSIVAGLNASMARQIATLGSSTISSGPRPPASTYSAPRAGSRIPTPASTMPAGKAQRRAGSAGAPDR